MRKNNGFGIASFVVGLTACGAFVAAYMTLIAEGIVGTATHDWGIGYVLFPVGTVLFWGSFLLCFPGMFLAVLGLCQPGKPRRSAFLGALLTAITAVPGGAYLVLYSLFPSGDWAGSPALLRAEAASLVRMYIWFLSAFCAAMLALYFLAIHRTKKIAKW